MSSDFGHSRGRSGSETVWRAMYDLVAGREAHSRLVKAADALGVAPGVVKTLLQLDGDGLVAMRDLAEFFRCDASYVTNLVDGLEEAGLAGRQPHPADRRVKVVKLTPKGVTALETVRRILDEPPEWFEVLSDAERKQLERVLGKLRAAAEAPAEAREAASAR